jgi:hypothetical protein
MCDTSISEFLAGISILSVAAHIAIVYFMRPHKIHITLVPSIVRRSATHHDEDDEDDETSAEDSTPSDDAEGSRDDDADAEGSRGDGVSKRGSLYSYFT